MHRSSSLEATPSQASGRMRTGDGVRGAINGNRHRLSPPNENLFPPHEMAFLPQEDQERARVIGGEEKASSLQRSRAHTHTASHSSRQGARSLRFADEGVRVRVLDIDVDGASQQRTSQQKQNVAIPWGHDDSNETDCHVDPDSDSSSNRSESLRSVGEDDVNVPRPQPSRKAPSKTPSRGELALERYKTSLRSSTRNLPGDQAPPSSSTASSVGEDDTVTAENDRRAKERRRHRDADDGGWCCLAGILALHFYRAVTHYLFSSFALLDEDDVLAAAAVTGFATTSQGAEVTAHMALAATKNIVGSVATGSSKAVAVAAAAGGVGAAGGAGGGASSSTTQTAVVVTAVAAAAVTAGLVVGDDGVSLLCTNVTDPSVWRGAAALDFLGTPASQLLTVNQAARMASTFVETYNDLFGCESDHHRLIVNCSVPCDVGENYDNSSQVCCSQLSDPVFGSLLRCSFDCYVHCKGCLASEPFFAITGDDESATVLGAGASEGGDDINSTRRGLQQADGDVFDNDACSPKCQISAKVEGVVCGDVFNESDSCIAVRFLAFDSSDTNRSRIADELPLVESPSSQPSSMPSLAPSMVPSLAPSASPTNDAVIDLVLYDAEGSDLGPLNGRTINTGRVGSDLTVQAVEYGPVDSIEFYFDEQYVKSEELAPYFLNGDEGGVGTPYGPLADPGEHNVTAIAFFSDAVVGRQTAIFAVV